MRNPVPIARYIHGLPTPSPLLINNLLPYGRGGLNITIHSVRYIPGLRSRTRTHMYRGRILKECLTFIRTTSTLVCLYRTQGEAFHYRSGASTPPKKGSLDACIICTRCVYLKKSENSSSICDASVSHRQPVGWVSCLQIHTYIHKSKVESEQGPSSSHGWFPPPTIN